MPPDRTRFRPAAAAALRAAIQENGGDEVFAVGRPDGEGLLAEVEVVARGNSHSVPALLSRPRAGESVIHNHPSGRLDPSEPDMHLAGRFGEDGVGFVIVNNAVSEARWVVEPLKREPRKVDPEEVRRFFVETLPRALPGHEPRQSQLEMALAVTAAFNGDQRAALEAGTGTGKSLAYLVPAVLWARANDSKVAIATFTLTLQAQLAGSDLPVLQRAGLDFKAALLKGRSNYVCRRRLAEALEGTTDPELWRTLKVVADWAERAEEGTRHDLAVPLQEDQWELIQSDHDQTLRARCPHFDRCYYYQARRKAADAHLLIVNHHLLLADMVLKKQGGGEGLLPRYERAIIDEGHHIEDAATSLMQERLTMRALRRATAPLGQRRGGRSPGALPAVLDAWGQERSPLLPADRRRLVQRGQQLQRELPELERSLRHSLEQLAADALDPQTRSLRVTAALRAGEPWRVLIGPMLEGAASRLAESASHLDEVDEVLRKLDNNELNRHIQAVFDIRRAARRLGEMAAVCTAMLGDQGDHVRWIEEQRERGQPVPTAALHLAPLEIGPQLRSQVFESLRTVVATSATITVNGQFQHWQERVGLVDADGLPDLIATGVFPSPFDYGRQALLAIPRDIPDPDAADFDERAAAVLIEAIEISRGGAFVLCTSFRMVDALHRRVEAALGRRFLLLRHGEMGRERLLQRFREGGNAVLFGTDSFWEGVSVAGEALRLVVIPRLPFRVPTEPVQQARYERIEARGANAFSSYALPQAVLRLRQGFGRLIRTASDRGVVLILDRRVSDRWYGRIFLQSLPRLPRAVGPWRAVSERMFSLYRGSEPAEDEPTLRRG